ncbi:MAG: PKD domain-containing protein [Bacteroidales bacterium]
MKGVKNISIFVLLIGLTVQLKAQDYSISLLPFNTNKYDELSPVYHRGDVVFCSNRKNSLFVTFTDEREELPLFDLYKVEEGRNSWGKAELFDKDFKSPFNVGPATFNGTGSEIYFTRNHKFEKKIGNSIDRNNKLGIYYSKFSRYRGGWSTPTPFKYNNPDYNVAHPTLSEDGQYLYFVSDMDGGYGGTDLYVCELEGSNWGEPQNLGPQINSEGNEFFPFIHSSGRLYFSSDGHEGLGRLDIFYSEKVNDEWHKPIGLDPPINSRYNDFGFIIDAFKKNGMFSSDRQRQSDDIYSFAPLYPMFENIKRMQENDHCYVFFEEGAQSLDSTTFEYQWVFSDGTKINGEEVEHCFESEGDYTVELNVIDEITGDVAFNQATYQLTIENVEQVYINSPDTVMVGQEVKFDGRQTNLQDFEIARYYWDFGDGRKTRGIEATHIYTAPGNYIVQLGVVSKSDREGNADKQGVFKNIVVLGQSRERRRGN